MSGIVTDNGPNDPKHRVNANAHEVLRPVQRAELDKGISMRIWRVAKVRQSVANGGSS